ncbi:PadR family transcriptional regulator [Nocardia seriolae]|uniref:PadR family transcriptional regulator n=1 Tax=Nocardia seriolae TaxID=37332 RepID=A0A0B8N9C0_9NOCA|nr:PadR family transcriptional regulator [Nocardia seriolae]MTJ65849.1 PadR family transcriptional regulator [Nocardia seriolae]MTJ72358.1 PadR family transcriptional regulator [Nocardia seriolae]MTJ86221.1 PadR family transcriptional regulator [Nocardia seriolae]MTK30217.1 PadR family transcriptional regulator [Nocardia seriolae]MTK43847.1 PadR family transcriptional regulator [Nocardia seriolae]
MEVDVTGKQAVPKLTPLALLVLALLEERPMHPYEMYQLLLSRHEDEFVKVKPGSLYHTVARLADQELVAAEGTDRAGNRPERTTYRIRRAGREALRFRVTELLREPVQEYPAFVPALAEAHNLPVDEVAAALRERVSWIDTRIADLTSLRELAVAREVPRRYWIRVDYVRAQAAAEAEWLRGFITELESGDLEWENFDEVSGERVGSQTTP